MQNYLYHVNPLVKMGMIVVLIFWLTTKFSIYEPLIVCIFAIGLTWILGKIDGKRWLLSFLPFLFVCVIYIWNALLFPSQQLKTSGEVLMEWGFVIVTTKSLTYALSLGLRVLAFTSLSLLFIHTTKPENLILSMVQHGKLSPKIAYSILAGYQFLPSMKEEFFLIQQANMVRGVPKARSIRGKILEMKRYAIPMMANAIRKAEQTAFAMEARGFTGNREGRTYYHWVPFSWRDPLFVALLTIPIVVSL
ncbi:energy-coupling factor transporter transmembrane component T family protein [Mangrovibacillus cuniculi]|uniref:Energy-coupling factor transporter transmembrane protein EcfT n=1 Tax=Mangrovibacillus cuniculi TaxID=2593652 RepID=A0A7S8C8T9_9BACI|nr:energy-coupling factor transporter transmembrane component T [Mangrovibacillus cuniculi]QPC45519.1 energy-coupling factor transporter transmembrane protein EcfT [Mangrovibacillus cuniculi]